MTLEGKSTKDNTADPFKYWNDLEFCLESAQPNLKTPAGTVEEWKLLYQDFFFLTVSVIKTEHFPLNRSSMGK